MPLDAAPLAPLLAGGDLAYVAVTSASGPMVTPVLFAFRDDRIWMVLPRRSAKVGAIARDALVGVTIPTPTATVVVQGEARVVDPLDASTLFSSIPEVVRSPRAAASYVVDNVRHLGGVVAGGSLEPRAMAAVRVERALVVRGTGDLWSEGDWRAGPILEGGDHHLDAPALDLADVPGDLATLAGEARPIFVGWRTPTGPVALPGAWDPDRRVATVRSDVFGAVGGAVDGPACVVFDATIGTDLDDKMGMVLRGAAYAHPRDDDAVDLAVDVERVSWWQGGESETVALAAS
ncbi:MAG TPA: pyridoxamine 5'-phosphate oxidase family protein [Acidimicrobiales bacterium]|nr:pyridoxamine 5'-phosphate oxidase family protein [Acidimicrobiales bacterium]